MYFYVVRHGETVQNVAAVYQWHTDWSLSSRGIDQMTMLLPFVESFGVDAVYTSDLGRCTSSLALIRQWFDEDVVITEDARLRWYDAWSFVWQSYQWYEKNPSQLIESAWEIWWDQKQFMKEQIWSLFHDLIDRHASDDSIFLMTHRSSIRYIHEYITGAVSSDLSVSTGGWSLYSLESASPWQWSCIISNSLDHQESL